MFPAHSPSSETDFCQFLSASSAVPTGASRGELCSLNTGRVLQKSGGRGEGEWNRIENVVLRGKVRKERMRPTVKMSRSWSRRQRRKQGTDKRKSLNGEDYLNEDEYKFESKPGPFLSRRHRKD